MNAKKCGITQDIKIDVITKGTKPKQEIGRKIKREAKFSAVKQNYKTDYY